MPEDVADLMLNSGAEQDAVVTTASGAKTIKCIYKNKYQAAKINMIDFESANPYMICAESDLTDVAHGDAVTLLETETLYVREIQPHGNNKLILQLSFD
ncbi:MAG: hypothetical protein C4539_14525 [Ignavibacteriales bacterium]|nr:MAG: hypothetical protein C4539_14525 [Ignavibacteriales bacterium]